MQFANTDADFLSSTGLLHVIGTGQMFKIKVYNQPLLVLPQGISNLFRFFINVQTFELVKTT